MRLIEGYRGEGLRGISPEADIANCQGIYGAYQSGGRDFTTTLIESAKALSLLRKRGKAGATETKKMLPHLNDHRIPNEYCKAGFEFGGVRVFRPLLHFRKEALQNALIEAKTPWLEDPTNRSPTTSVRNAIRFLLRENLLPNALSGGQGSDGYNLMLAAGKIQQRFEDRDGQAEELFQACDIISFDSRTGSLEVRLPMFTENGAHFSSRPRIHWKSEREYIGARLIRLLFLLVTPQDHVSLQSLKVATTSMFFDFMYAKDFPPPAQRKNHPAPAVFTAGGVYCERVESPIGDEVQSEPDQSCKLDPEYTWRLSRQPYHRSHPRPECVFAPTPFSHLAAQGKRKHGEVTYSEPPWQLWDGRYWVQILNKTRKIMKISPLTESQLLNLRSSLTGEDGKPTAKFESLQQALKDAAPGGSRFVLPAITDDEGNVLVLPTLNFEVGGSGLQWRIRYRRVIFPRQIRREAVVALPEKELTGTKPSPLTSHHERIIAERREAKAEERAAKREKKEEERKRLGEETVERERVMEEERKRLEEQRRWNGETAEFERTQELDPTGLKEQHERLEKPKRIGVRGPTAKYKPREERQRFEAGDRTEQSRWPGAVKLSGEQVTETAKPRRTKPTWQDKIAKKKRKKEGVEKYWQKPERQEREAPRLSQPSERMTPGAFKIRYQPGGQPGNTMKGGDRNRKEEGVEDGGDGEGPALQAGRPETIEKLVAFMKSTGGQRRQPMQMEKGPLRPNAAKRRLRRSEKEEKTGRFSR